MTAAVVHRLRARNVATDSENRIHDDDVARRHGFRGGLVPGVTVYGYMTRPVVELLGRPWLERGTVAARFVQPVYDGEEIAVTATPADGGHLVLEVRSERGEVCATGSATVAEAPPPAPALEDFPAAPLPEQRPPADEASLAVGTVLGSVSGGFHADRSAPFLELLADDLPIYAAEGVAHPGYLILSANTILAANVALGPWVHVSSEVTNLAAVPDGAVVETRGRVADLFERKGHRFVKLDVVWLADGRPVMRADHTAIYRLRGD
ncbi:MAG TPA: hypothetical protein VFA11_07015 [Acidimicrobiales bacterium]|nr:hypothetical protein [Acidimicrobiales bacterium]